MKSKRVCLTCNPGRDELSCPAPGGFPRVEGLLPGIYEKPVEVKKYKNCNLLFYLFILHFPQKILQKEIYIITKIAQFTGKATKKVQN